MDKQIASPSTKAGRTSGGRFRTGILGSLKGVGGALAGTLAIGAGLNLFKGFIGDARESARISALTAQAIKSTGGAANVTAGQVGALATKLSEKTGIDDEAIQSGANLLLTFTNVRNELGKGNKIFDQANATVTDMSAALGQDTKSSAIQLGKALNDPVKGITALSRVGVAFTAGQKEQITAMVASGNTLGAQKVILKELGKEFGGAAAAMATPGDRLKVTLGNLGESIGAQLLPAIDRFATFMVTRGIPAMTRFGGYIQTNVLPVLVRFGGFIQARILPALRAFGLFVATNIVPALQRIGLFVATSVLPALARLGGFLRTNLLPSFVALRAFLFGSVIPALAGLGRVLVIVAPTFLRVGLFVGKVVGVLAALAIIIIGRVLPVIFRLAGVVFPILITAIGVVIRINARLIAAVFGIISALVRVGVAVARFVARVVGHFTALRARVLTAVGDFGSFLFSAGQDLVRGLVNGIKSLAMAPVNAIKGIGGKIAGGFKGVLGIGSPSKVFTELGLNLPKSLAGGMNKGTALVTRASTNMAHRTTAPFGARVGARQADIRHPVGSTGGTVHLTVNNPLPERAAESTANSLRRLSWTHGLAVA